MHPVNVLFRSRLMGRVVLFAALAGTPGCGESRPAPVDSGRAHEALKAALDGWKKGAAPTALTERSPEIVVQDLDWIEGARLVDYEVAGSGKQVESNLYVPVKLTLRDRQGKEVTKSVSYVIATAPRLMVFRSLQ